MKVLNFVFSPLLLSEELIYHRPGNKLPRSLLMHQTVLSLNSLLQERMVAMNEETFNLIWDKLVSVLFLLTIPPSSIIALFSQTL